MNQTKSKTLLSVPAFKRRIHIIPINPDKDNLDEVCMPLITMKTDKVYLMITTNAKLGDPERIESGIHERIKDTTNAEIIRFGHFVPTDNLYGIIHEYRKIISAEDGNDIYICIGSGSYISAVAGMMTAGMYSSEKDPNLKATGYPRRVLPYMVKQDEIVIMPPDITIDVPPYYLIEALSVIAKLEEKCKECHETLTINMFAKGLEGIGIAIPGGNIAPGTLANLYNTLNRRYIKPLLALGYIYIEAPATNKKKISLTEKGKNALIAFWMT